MWARFNPLSFGKRFVRNLVAKRQFGGFSNRSRFALTAQ